MNTLANASTPDEDQGLSAVAAAGRAGTYPYRAFRRRRTRITVKRAQHVKDEVASVSSTPRGLAEARGVEQPVAARLSTR